MSGAIAAIIITIWFYKSALATGKNPVTSAVLGLTVYFTAALIWTLAVTPGLRDTIAHEPSFLLGMVVRHAYAVVGFTCAAWVKHKHFASAQE